MEYGCIGEHLTHSFSGQIHGQLQDYVYELKEIPQGQLAAFMEKRDFKAINVTLPYKQAVIPYLQEVEETAARIGAVNTVVNRKGRLYGYNTDFGGMIALIRRTGIDLKGKKVLILGTGGTSKTATAVAQTLGAGAVWRVSRRKSPGVLTYEEAVQNHQDAQVLINTTPRGMYGQDAGMALDPALFPQLCGVIDAVYNPLRTEFVEKARSLGVPAAGGLYMLVKQAVLASEIFLDVTYPEAVTDNIYGKLKNAKENIVLTGMPGSGKTTLGKLLSSRLQRPFLDTDQLITQKTGLTPAQLIEDQGEPAFRQLETEVIRTLSTQTGCIIATGGGAVLSRENVSLLRQNGRLYFLDRPVEQLLPTAERPLSATKEALWQRYRERYDIYCATADVTISNHDSPEAAAQGIEEEFFK